MGSSLNREILASLLAISSMSATEAWVSVHPVRGKLDPSVLANLEVLSEAKHPESPAIHVRVYRVVEHGECAGSPQSCPLSTVYVAASEYGEFPEQHVFELPKRHNWSFVAWRQLPKTDGPDDYVVLELRSDLPSPTPNSGWWVEKRELLRVNYRKAGMAQP